MAFAPDGDVIVLGAVHDHDDEREKYALWRLNPDGTLDTAFGRDGRVIFVPEDPYHIELGEVAVGPDGKIVVNGYGESFEFEDLAHVSVAVRHNPDGSLDTTFGLDGVEHVRPQAAVRQRPHGAGPDRRHRRRRPRLRGRRRRARLGRRTPRRRRHRRRRHLRPRLAPRHRQGRAGRRSDPHQPGPRPPVREPQRPRLQLHPHLRRLRPRLGRDGNDAVTVTTEVPDLRIRGGAGNDTLRGGPGRDMLLGRGRRRPDRRRPRLRQLSGGNGKDVLDYRSRTNALRLVGNQGGEAGERDTFGPDFETLYGGSGDDELEVTSYAGGAVYGGARQRHPPRRFRERRPLGRGRRRRPHQLPRRRLPPRRRGQRHLPRRRTTDRDGHALSSRSTASPTTAAPAKATTSSPTSRTSSAATATTTSPARPPTTASRAATATTRSSGWPATTRSSAAHGADTLTDTQGTNTLDGGRGADTINGVTEPSDAVTLQAEKPPAPAAPASPRRAPATPAPATSSSRRRVRRVHVQRALRRAIPTHVSLRQRRRDASVGVGLHQRRVCNGLGVRPHRLVVPVGERRSGFRPPGRHQSHPVNEGQRRSPHFDSLTIE